MDDIESVKNDQLGEAGVKRMEDWVGEIEGEWTADGCDVGDEIDDEEGTCFEA
jgi:hypothetical protein